MLSKVDLKRNRINYPKLILYLVVVLVTWWASRRVKTRLISTLIKEEKANGGKDRRTGELS